MIFLWKAVNNSFDIHRKNLPFPWKGRFFGLEVNFLSFRLSTCGFLKPPPHYQGRICFLWKEPVSEPARRSPP
jgi:hypothetical protein